MSNAKWNKLFAIVMLSGAMFGMIVCWPLGLIINAWFYYKTGKILFIVFFQMLVKINSDEVKF